MAKKPRFSNGKKGAALPIRVIPRAKKNEVVEILKDQTVKIRLTAPPVDNKANEELIKFLSDILDVPRSKFEIVAGATGRDKLVSILDVTSEDVTRKLLEQLS